MKVIGKSEDTHSWRDFLQVLSASGGIRVDHLKMSTDVVVLVYVVILVCLFSMQHYGTDKVGRLFVPVVLVWFLMVGGIGIFNIYKYDRRGRREGWMSLEGIIYSQYHRDRSAFC